MSDAEGFMVLREIMLTKTDLGKPSKVATNLGKLQNAREVPVSDFQEYAHLVLTDITVPSPDY